MHPCLEEEELKHQESFTENVLNIIAYIYTKTRDRALTKQNLTLRESLVN